MAALFAALLCGQIFSKLCSNTLSGGDKSGYTVFLTVNGIIACAFFFVSSGFRLTLTPLTVLYSVVYAVIVFLCLVFTMKAYSVATLSCVYVVKSACELIATSCIGFIFYKEEINAEKIVRILLMIAAVLLIFADLRKNTAALRSENNTPRRKLFKTVAVLSILITSSVMSTVVLKLYSEETMVSDNNSFFFFTNVFLIIGSIGWFLIRNLKNPKILFHYISEYNPKSLLLFSGNTVCSNITSLVGILLIAKIDVSVYTPVTAALGIVCAVLASVLMREKPGLLNLAAALVAAAAVII